MPFYETPIIAKKTTIFYVDETLKKCVLVIFENLTVKKNQNVGRFWPANLIFDQIN